MVQNIGINGTDKSENIRIRLQSLTFTYWYRN